MISRRLLFSMMLPALVALSTTSASAATLKVVASFTVLADVLTWTEEAPLVFCCGKPPPHSWALYRGPLQ